MAEHGLGAWLAAQRARPKGWLWALATALALLAVANVFIGPAHPHFAADTIPEFWAAFGFGGAVAMIFVLKIIIAPILKRPEDYYDRDQ